MARWYLLSCPQCGWRSAPVEAHVMEQWIGHRCKDCKAANRPDVLIEIREKLVVGRKD